MARLILWVLYLLEKEVVINKLLLSLWVHAIEWVEGTLEITLESVASFNDLGHDFVSLFLGDSWSEWVTGKVSSNSDSGGHNHSCIIFWELSIFDTLRDHF